MHLVIVSFKQCWQGQDGAWFSSGGFPYQIAAISSLFERVTLVVVKCAFRPGGIPLPPNAEVVGMRPPLGSDLQRKKDVLRQFPYYIRTIGSAIRQADVVHTPLPGDLPLVAMLITILMGKRLIARYGGSWERNAQNTRANDLTRLVMRTFAGGRRVMLVTGVGTTPPGRNMHWMFSTALSRNELSSTKPVLDRGIHRPARLAYLGRFSPEKGVSVLLQAMARLSADHFEPMPHLVLVGDGPQHQELKSLADGLKLDGTVSFAGQLDRAHLSAELDSVDLCVQPSLTESFSKAWLDAFAHGHPVITSDVGASQDVIGRPGERGWILPPGNVDRLTDCLKTVLSSDIDWPSMRRRCRTYAEQFTLEDWADRIGKICAAQWKIPYQQGKLSQ